MFSAFTKLPDSSARASLAAVRFDCSIVRIPLSPAYLRLLPPGGLTLRLAPDPLPVSHSRVRLEPPAAHSTWLLPDLQHRDDPSWSSPARGVRSECQGH